MKRLVVFFLLAVFLSGCGGVNNLEGWTFYSENTKKTGLGPNGETARGYWYFRFYESDFGWQYSDTGVTGTYRLNNESELELTFKHPTFPSENEMDTFTLDLSEEQTEFEFQGTRYLREDIHEAQ